MRKTRNGQTRAIVQTISLLILLGGCGKGNVITKGIESHDDQIRVPEQAVESKEAQMGGENPNIIADVWGLGVDRPSKDN